MGLSQLRIAILMFFEHPLGLKYVRALMHSSHAVCGIVAERHAKQEQFIRKRYQEKMGKEFSFETCSDVIDGAQIPIYFVRGQSSLACEQLLTAIAPDILLLGGAGIIKENILRIPRIGTLSVHPGLIPMYRGCTNVEWALYQGDPVGATCYFVTKEIDWGKIVLRKTLSVSGKSYHEICRDMDTLCLEILMESLEMIRRDGFAMHLEEPVRDRSKYYKPISAELLDVVRSRSY